jgi:(5-formylfuran-3-yl)methyl phosphate synthase
MRLLVSVASAPEAAEAIDGGADVIDAKDPLNGALGAVSTDVFSEIAATVNRRRLLTAALGDATSETAVERLVCAFASQGATLVKVGFGGTMSFERAAALLAAAVRGARIGGNGHAGVVAVAYADADHAASLDCNAVISVAAATGAAGVLLDTADKRGPGLRHLMTVNALADWVATAHDAALLAAVAGKLAGEDFSFARDAGADIVGVRGAACSGGRTRRVDKERVRVLRECLSRNIVVPAILPCERRAQCLDAIGRDDVCGDVIRQRA